MRHSLAEITRSWASAGLGVFFDWRICVYCRSEIHVASVSLRFSLILEAYCRGNIWHIKLLIKQVKSHADTHWFQALKCVFLFCAANSQPLPCLSCIERGSAQNEDAEWHCQIGLPEDDSGWPEAVHQTGVLPGGLVRPAVTTQPQHYPHWDLVSAGHTHTHALLNWIFRGSFGPFLGLLNYTIIHLCHILTNEPFVVIASVNFVLFYTVCHRTLISHC